MDMYEPQALAAIRASTRTPIASLETILGCRALKPYLDAHCADVAIVDPQYNGVPEAVRMAAMCDAYEVNVASHYFAGPLAAIICAHFAAVIPNLRISEYDVDEVPWKPKLLSHPPVIANGEFVLPTGPGCGDDHLRELERAVKEDDLRGVLISSSHRRAYPDDDDARPFFRLACNLDIPVFMHPPSVGFGEERMKEFRLASSVGRPFDSC